MGEHPPNLRFSLLLVNLKSIPVPFKVHGAIALLFLPFPPETEWSYYSSLYFMRQRDINDSVRDSICFFRLMYDIMSQDKLYRITGNTNERIHKKMDLIITNE